MTYNIRCLSKKDTKKLNKKGLDINYKKKQLYCLVNEDGTPFLAGDDTLILYKTKSKDKTSIVLGVMEYFRNYGIYSTIADVSMHCGESINPSFVGLFYSPFSSDFKPQKHISNVIIGKIDDDVAKEALNDMATAIKGIISHFEDDLINETPTLSCKQSIIQQGFKSKTTEKEEPKFEVKDDEVPIIENEDEIDEETEKNEQDER